MKLPDRLEARVPLRLTFNPSRKQNFLHLTFSDTNVEVMIDGIKVGEVRACIGGGIEVCLGNNSEAPIIYTVSPIDLWRAVRAMVPGEEAVASADSM